MAKKSKPISVSASLREPEKQDGNPTLVPKLRFPEFQEAALRSVLLGDVTEEGRSRNGQKHLVTSVMGVTKANGIVPMEARLIAAHIARYKLVQRDWFAYNPMRLNIGSIARWKGESEILVSPDYVVFKCLTEAESGIAPGYFDHFRLTKTWEEFVTEGGDGSVRVRIYYKDIARVGLVLPPFPEQQKIAECLSSVDELMAAQARKVDALKTHKKGLMQQLFPREGETQPRLRFPEFQNAGEWAFGALDDVLLVTSNGLNLPQSAGNTGYKVTRIETISAGTIDLDKIGFVKTTQDISSYLLRVGDILFSNINSIAHIGKSVYVDNDYGLYHGMNLLRLVVNRQKCDPKFLFYLINTSDIRASFRERANKAVNQASINQTELGRTFVAVPSIPEQQRIASCLSSLDALITAETQKHDALRTHKRGLMQQLFPSPEEATP